MTEFKFVGKLKGVPLSREEYLKLGLDDDYMEIAGGKRYLNFFKVLLSCDR